MTKFVRDEISGDVMAVTDDDPRATGDAIGTSIQQQGFYQSPEGWAIVTGSPGGQLGGAPRIIVEPGGKQPPQDVISRYPMASPQEMQGFQQQAAQYRAGEGKPVPFSTAVLSALGAYGAGSAIAGLGGAAGGASTVGDIGGGLDTPASLYGGGGGSNLGSLGSGGAFDMGGTAGTLGEGASGAGVDGVQAGVDAANSESGYTQNDPNATGRNIDGSGIGPSTATTSATTAAKSGAISRILDGTATAADYLSVGAAALPGVLGAITSSQQASKLSDLAQQYSNYGAPSRARYEASFQPGFTMASDPGYQDALDSAGKTTLHALSVNGNPAGSPNAWAASQKDLYDKTAYPALQAYRNTNSVGGGLASGASAAPDLATKAIAQTGTTMADLGGAAKDVFAPTTTVDDLLKKLKGSGNIFAVPT